MPVLKATAYAPPAAPVDLVECRVTAQGHGKISTGKHHALGGEEFFAKGETFIIDRAIAEELRGDDEWEQKRLPRARYYVEILGPAKPQPVEKAA